LLALRGPPLDNPSEGQSLPSAVRCGATRQTGSGTKAWSSGAFTYSCARACSCWESRNITLECAPTVAFQTASSCPSKHSLPDIFTFSYAHPPTHPHSHARTHTRTHARTLTHTHAHAHRHRHRHTHTHTDIHPHTKTHIYIHTYIHTHTHKHIFITKPRLLLTSPVSLQLRLCRLHRVSGAAPRRPALRGQTQRSGSR
jgi:hypothetical protein